MNTLDEIALNGRHLVGGRHAGAADSEQERKYRDVRIKTEIQLDAIRTQNKLNRQFWAERSAADSKSRDNGRL